MQLIASFTALRGTEEAMGDLLAAYAAVVRSGDGTAQLDACQGPSTLAARPGGFLVVEQYRDEAAFRAPVNAAALTACNKDLAPLISGDVALRLLRPLHAE